MLTWRSLFLASALVLLEFPASAGPLVYIETSNPLIGASGFGTIDVSTGAFQPIGPGPTDPGAGLVPGSNGSLFTLGYSGNLDSINPSTGLETLVGATGLGDCSNPPVSPCGPSSANAFGSLNGKLYATDFAGTLYGVDPVTGHATLIGLTGIPAITFVPFSMNADGTLNVFDENLFDAEGKLYANIDILKINPNTGAIASVVLADALYQIDPTTGHATFVTPTTTPLNSFVNVNGTEYTFNGGNLPTQILTVNLTNGSTTFVSNADPAAGLIFGASPTPEPASIVLAAIGIVAFALCRFRRRSSDQLRAVPQGSDFGTPSEESAPGEVSATYDQATAAPFWDASNR